MTGKNNTEKQQGEAPAADSPDKGSFLSKTVSRDAIRSFFRSTWIWRTFGVCIGRNKWAKVLFWMAFFPLGLTVMFFCEFITPVYDLPEMNKTEGVLVSAATGGRISHKKFVVRKDDGEEVVFRGTLPRDIKRVRAAIGKRVTVWSQVRYLYKPPFVCERFWQIQEGDTIIVDYSKDQYQYRISQPPRDFAMMIFFLFLFLIHTSLLWLVCWRWRKRNKTE